MPYKFLEHTADIKLHVTEKTIEKAFISSAHALFETVYGKIKVKNNISKEISVKGEDFKSLLYSFLEEFLFLLDSEGILITEIKKLKIKDNKLSAVIYGDYAKNYNFTNSVKAITYSDMIIKQNKDHWLIEAVLDV